MRLYLLIMGCLWLPATLAWPAPVTVRVDMGPYLTAGYFEPATDRIEVRGDFSGWVGDLHHLAAGAGGLHAATLDLLPGPIAYKFVIVRESGAVVWEDHVANRTATVPPAGLDLPPVAFDDMSAAPDAARRLVGADLSFVPHLESLGVVYGAPDQPEPLLPLMLRSGHTLVRLRLWHDPAEPWHGLEATVAFARQIRDAGCRLMLDVHYSDTWADPGRQTAPAAWAELPVAALIDSIGAYTTTVIHRFAAEQIPLAYVQIGNEIDGGLLWEAGRVGWSGSPWDTSEQWSVLTALLQSAAGAVRAGSPPDAMPQIIVHVSAGGNNAHCRWFFDQLAAAGVDHDVIGLSFYPWWHGTLWNLDANLRDLLARYGKEVMVVETAYPWTLDFADGTHNFVGSTDQLHDGYPATPRGQRDFLRDVRRVVECAGGSGVIYWEPAFLPVPAGPGNPWENQTLFDFTGVPLPALDFGLPAGSVAAAAIPISGAALLQNHPNPFNPITEIAYSLPRAGRVSLKIYDLEGQHVRTLVDSVAQPGHYRARWTATDDHGQAVASGTYLYVLETEAGVETRKMVLIR